LYRHIYKESGIFPPKQEAVAMLTWGLLFLGGVGITAWQGYLFFLAIAF
jgi:hypothetical protein